MVTVLTAEDSAGVLNDVPTRALAGDWPVDELRPVEQPVLARGKVCYVGQPVAIAVARDRYQARDALEGILVDGRL